MATPAAADLQRRLNLGDDEYAALLELAQENDRTVSAEIRRAIRAHLTNQTQTAKSS